MDITGFLHKSPQANQASSSLEQLLAAVDEQADSKAASSTRFSELETILNGLSREYRIPFLMARQGYDITEIARQLRLPPGTVKSRLFYARKTLKHKIDEYCRKKAGK